MNILSFLVVFWLVTIYHFSSFWLICTVHLCISILLRALYSSQLVSRMKTDSSQKNPVSWIKTATLHFSVKILWFSSLYSCKRKFTFKVEQLIDTEVKCAFSGDLQQSKLALNMCKTSPTNSHIETDHSWSSKYLGHLSLHLKLLISDYSQWSESFQTWMFWSMWVMGEIMEKHPDYRSVSCTKGFIAFLSLRWFEAVPCYAAMMVSKARLL